MKIAILLYDGYIALDMIGPYEILNRMPQAKVTFVAEKAGPVQSDTTMLPTMAEKSLAEMPKPDVVVIPGGFAGVEAAVKNQAILDWVRTTHDSAQRVVSVCTGALILGAAGLLRGKRATTHWYWRNRLATYGAEYVPERFVDSGKITTAAGVTAGIDAALRLAAELSGESVARTIQLGIEYDPKPPFNSGSLQTASLDIVKLAELGFQLEFTKERLRTAVNAVRFIARGNGK